MIQQMNYTPAFEEKNSLLVNQYAEIIPFLLKANAQLKKENHQMKESINNLKETLLETKEELKQETIRAEQAESVKKEFLAQISHEIRTPLNIIINYTDLIRDELSEYINDETELFFNAIEVDSKRLIRTIDLMLNMSTLKNGNYKSTKENFDIENVLSTVLSDFRLEAQDKNLDLLFEKDASNKIVSADRYAVQQVFIHLISNALKFTEHGFIKVKTYNEAEYVCTDIEDTGRGISDDYIAKLYEPFSQEDHGFSRRYDGNGLGLAVVKKYLQLNNGKIKVQSRIGQGTIFTVKFKTMWK